VAGNWIKFETATTEKPEVWAIADVLGIDPDAVVGKLLRVWVWFDEHTENGNAPTVTKKLLDRSVNVTGFVDAMISVGWMLESDVEIILPNFDRHNGKTSKNRALTAKRVANHKKSNAEGNAEGNDDGVSGALPRIEKNRIDKDKDNNPPNPPEGESEHPKPDKPPPQKKPRARKTKLPDEFELTEHRTKLAVNYWASKGRWDLSVEDQFFKFRNHHTAKGSTMADWDAAWQTWYSNAVEFTKPTGGQPHAAGQRIDNSAAGRVRANIARERAQEDREAQGANLVGADVIDVWPQMD